MDIEISETATNLLTEAGFDPETVAAELEIEDGGRLTVAAARKYIEENKTDPPEDEASGQAPAQAPPEPLNPDERAALEAVGPKVIFTADPPAEVREAIVLDIAAHGITPRVLAHTRSFDDGRPMVTYLTSDGITRRIRMRAPVLEASAPTAGLVELDEGGGTP